MRIRALWIMTVTACCGAVDGVSAHDKLPSGPGLAAKYPGDAGIDKDPAVLLAEDFEAGSLQEVLKRWSEASNADGKVLALAEDQAVEGVGKHAIQMTAHYGDDTGGHLYSPLKRAVDKAFARFYVKFPKPANYIHHFVHFGGYHPSTRWPQGGAGEKPRGDDRITVGIEPFGFNGREAAPGLWNFYAYWHEMKVSAGGKYWGNGLQPIEPQRVPVDRWQCVEMMIQLNTPGKRDGALALWLDGALAADFRAGVRRGPWTGMGFALKKEGGEPFEGFDFRTTNDLKVNFFWLLHYVTESSTQRNQVKDPPKENRVWFDNIVVATEYIGPVQVKGR